MRRSTSSSLDNLEVFWAMPRQPLPEKFRQLWSIGPKEIEKRPEHVAIIGKCIALWPEVDQQMATLFGILLGSDPESAVAVFSVVRMFRTQREVLIAAAEMRLDAQDMELLDAVLTIVGSASKERDALGHGCYGICPRISDGILWVESKYVAPWTVSMLLKESAGLSYTGTEHDELARRIFVYRMEDLEAVYNEIDETQQIAFEFVAYVRWRQKPSLRKGVTRDGLYHLLCTRPRLQIALAGC
ncbi:MAG: hypothetical protein WDN03_14235 [Rhizomicrobium sp.]